MLRLNNLTRGKDERGFAIGYRQSFSKKVNRWLPFGRDTESVIVKEGMRVLVLGQPRGRIRSIIHLLRKNDLCYVKYGSSVEHLIAGVACAQFDHFILRGDPEFYDVEAVRMVQSLTQIDLHQLILLNPGEFVHWSRDQEVAHFLPFSALQKV